MIKLMSLVFLVAITTGCSPLHPSGCQKKTALDWCEYKGAGKVSDKDIYGKQASGIKKALDAQLENPGAWSGKTCNMHLDFDYDGHLIDLIIKDGGDKDYCDALIVAAKKAKFPPFTDQKVYNEMSSARWNMQGYP